MYKDVLRSMEGFAAYPVIALLLFFGAFLAIAIWAVRMPRQDIEQASRLPLDDDAPLTASADDSSDQGDAQHGR